MGVGSFRVLYYVCKCDICGKISEAIEGSTAIYNSAQAARSIGWSFGKDGKVHCEECRRRDWNDRYAPRWR